METLNTTEKSTYLKAILGALIFLAVGILLTSKTVNFSENTAKLILQVYSLSLVLIAISLNGYYFEKPTSKDELLGKILSFSIILIPTALIFFVNQPYQELFFFASFFIGICFMLAHGITFKREKENYLLAFLTSVWSLLGVIVLVKHYNLLPPRFFNELSFLQLDKIKTIRLILLVGISAIKSVTTIFLFCCRAATVLSTVYFKKSISDFSNGKNQTFYFCFRRTCDWWGSGEGDEIYHGKI